MTEAGRMTDQLPVPISRKRAIVKKRTPPQIVVPMLIADAGEQASWRYVEFFTANIRNPNTRRAYARACGSFLTWCEERGLTLTPVHPRRRGERWSHADGGVHQLLGIGRPASCQSKSASRLPETRKIRAEIPPDPRAETWAVTMIFVLMGNEMAVRGGALGHFGDARRAAVGSTLVERVGDYKDGDDALIMARDLS